MDLKNNTLYLFKIIINNQRTLKSMATQYSSYFSISPTSYYTDIF